MYEYENEGEITVKGEDKGESESDSEGESEKKMHRNNACGICTRVASSYLFFKFVMILNLVKCLFFIVLAVLFHDKDLFYKEKTIKIKIKKKEKKTKKIDRDGYIDR